MAFPAPSLGPPSEPRHPVAGDHDQDGTGRLASSAKDDDAVQRDPFTPRRLWPFAIFLRIACCAHHRCQKEGPNPSEGPSHFRAPKSLRRKARLNFWDGNEAVNAVLSLGEP